VALIAFCAAAVALLLVIYALDPAIYTQTLLITAPAGEPHPPVVVAFLIAILIFVGMLAVGIARRWRWVFWGILVAFAASALQVPASALELAVGWPERLPAWYAVLRGVVAVAQIVIAVWMLRILRVDGVWGMGRAHPSSSRR
jgi:hypothetical protein